MGTDKIAEALCGKLGPVVLDAETSDEIPADAQRRLIRRASMV
jgi:hypothetical protein